MAIKKIEIDALELLSRLSRAQAASGLYATRVEIFDSPATIPVDCASLRLYNDGAATVWVGGDDGVTIGVGLPLAPGAATDLPVAMTGALFGVVDTDTSSALVVVEWLR